MSETKIKLNFDVPASIISDQVGYEFLSYVSFKCVSAKNKEIVFNFSENTLFEANLCSPFGALLESLKENGNTIIFEHVESSIRAEFEKNGFYALGNSLFKLDVCPVTIFDFKRFTLDDTVSFQDYINEQLLAHKDFPLASSLLKKKINKSIFEIFNNAHTHGRCEFVYTCGKYSTIDAKLKFTISDMGKTIRKNVNDYFKSKSAIHAKDAILWAVQEGNTTKKGNIPGGLGLSLIRDFLRLNEGGIQIISSNGYWEEKNGVIFDNALRHRFLGTIVNLEFNMNDNKSYVLASEIDPKNVL